MELVATIASKVTQTAQAAANNSLITPNTLNLITFVLAGIIIAFIIFFGKCREADETTHQDENEKTVLKGWAKIQEFMKYHSYKIYFSLFVLGFSFVLITSYEVIYSPPTANDLTGLLLTYLKERSIVFLILVLFKTFLIYWLVFAITGIFTMDQLQKFSLEVLGIKIAAERSKEEKAMGLSERVSDNIEAMKRFNDKAAQYISSAFESDILDVDSRKTAVNIRTKIEELLKEAYEEFDRLAIKVLPATSGAIALLKDSVKMIAMPVFNRTVYLRNDQIGIIAYNQVDDFETVVILDATESKYNLNDSEIYGIALFVGSFINILAWARKGSLS